MREESESQWRRSSARAVATRRLPVRSLGDSSQNVRRAARSVNYLYAGWTFREFSCSPGVGPAVLLLGSAAHTVAFSLRERPILNAAVVVGRHLRAAAVCRRAARVWSSRHAELPRLFTPANGASSHPPHS